MPMPFMKRWRLERWRLERWRLERWRLERWRLERWRLETTCAESRAQLGIETSAPVVGPGA
jgi:hypothetical protein